MYEIASDMIENTIKFHGHICPGLAIGIRVSELALELIGHNDAGGVVRLLKLICAV